MAAGAAVLLGAAAAVAGAHGSSSALDGGQDREALAAALGSVSIQVYLIGIGNLLPIQTLDGWNHDEDADGVADRLDAFPLDPTEWSDRDGDGVGDNGDAFPDDPRETSDRDGDGLGDGTDPFPDEPIWRWIVGDGQLTLGLAGLGKVRWTSLTGLLLNRDGTFALCAEECWTGTWKVSRRDPNR
ncbi:MAG: hypothetical protein ACQGVK_02105 [Myxococcota bacterium]